MRDGDDAQPRGMSDAHWKALRLQSVQDAAKSLMEAVVMARGGEGARHLDGGEIREVLSWWLGKVGFQVSPTGPAENRLAGQPENILDFLSEVDDEFASFFRKLGYTVTWDFDRNGKWYEIWGTEPGERRLICQVDKHVPLKAFLQDLPSLVEGKSGDSGVDYVVNGHPDDVKGLHDKIRTSGGKDGVQ